MTQIREKLGLFLTLISISFIYPIPVTAASLLAVCESNDSVSECGKNDIVFPTYKVTNGVATFNYKIDQGPLGEISEDEAFTDAVDVLDLWEAESSLDFVGKDGGIIDQDVDDSNYEDYLETSSSLGYSPVIWDDDGSITEELAGRGSKHSVLGFAGASFFHFSSGHVTGIKESQAAFNGFLFDGDNTNETPSQVRNVFVTTILHEFGHMFGIDHTQGGNLQGFKNDDSDLSDVPVMFPISANTLVELQHDDIAIAKEAYPKGSESQSYGRIEGTLTDDGIGVQGANIVAFKIDDSNPRKRAVACPSDVDGQHTGKFILPTLVPGNYILFAEPIDSDFTGGSSVGSYDPIDSSDFNTGFYNGDGEAIIESDVLNTGISQAKQITVLAGTTTTVSFETNSSGTGGITRSFTAQGGAFNKAQFLKSGANKKTKIILVNLVKGQKSIRFTTDYPDLITFLPANPFTLSGKSKVVKVVLAPFEDFLAAIPELENSSFDIPVTIEDLDTGFIDSSKTITVF